MTETSMIGTLVSTITNFLVPLITILGVCIVVALFIKITYRQSPPNQAMIVTGPFGYKTYIGKGTFVIPIIQRADYITLENIQADFVSKQEIPTRDAINILVDAVANVSISQEEDLLKIASSNFLGYGKEEINNVITPVLEGNIREIISEMTLKELMQCNKKVLSEKVIENVTPNLRDLGLKLNTFNIQAFKDKRGVIENLGIENTVQISKDAAIAKASAEKEIAIAQAEAKKLSNDAQVVSELEIANTVARAKKEMAIVQAEADREAKEAQINADTLIAQKQNELEIRKAELQKEADSKKAIADAAYQIQQETERKSIEIAEAEANLARQEKAILIQEKEVELAERTLEAEIKKQADADRYAKEQAADAMFYERKKKAESELFERQKKAEAEKFEKEKEAEVRKAMAEAENYAMKQEAEGVEALGKAEAEATKAKLLAEAEGTREKAEAMKQMGEAAIIEMYLDKMPEIAKNIAAPLGNVDKITMYGDGNNTKLMKDVMNTMNQVNDGLMESMGLDIKSVLAGVVGTKFLDNTSKE